MNFAIIVILSFVAILSSAHLISVFSGSSAIPCDYFLLKDTYEFQIVDCAFTPDHKDYRLAIVYKVINDGAGALAN